MKAMGRRCGRRLALAGWRAGGAAGWNAGWMDGGHRIAFIGEILLQHRHIRL